MTWAEFKKTWSRYKGKESSAYQEHLNDLCHLLGHLRIFCLFAEDVVLVPKYNFLNLAEQAVNEARLTTSGHNAAGRFFRLASNERNRRFQQPGCCMR